MVVVDKPFRILPGELRCPRCFGKDIVPSMPRGWRDAVMRLFGGIPRHCRFCACRFYVRLRRGAGNDPTGLGEDR